MKKAKPHRYKFLLSVDVKGTAQYVRRSLYKRIWNMICDNPKLVGVRMLEMRRVE